MSENAECLCGHLEEYHDENGWCTHAGCVCGFFDTADEESDLEAVGMQIVDDPDEEYAEEVVCFLCGSVLIESCICLSCDEEE